MELVSGGGGLKVSEICFSDLLISPGIMWVYYALYCPRGEFIVSPCPGREDFLQGKCGAYTVGLCLLASAAVAFLHILLNRFMSH
jgi:hypothetical protein